jgi:acylphosphatase
MTGALNLRIEGRVQGVGYRAWLEGKAAAQGLRGWVRNRRDGSVEAFISGPAPVVAEMIEACRRGPRLATVTNLAATPAADDGSAGFRQLPTA